MPTAAKLEKQPSTEVAEPLTKAIIVLEHKVRNLEKRKRKIEIYREDQSKGQTLNSDQLSAVAKYDEVTKNLDFAQDLCKTFSTIATENVKGAKKQGRKEAVERSLQDIARVREILVIQDILHHMGQESVRADFLAGQNSAALLTEQDLKFLDDLYIAVLPKRNITEDNLPPFEDQASQAAEHFLGIVEGKQKDAFGTTYEYLKVLITKIQGSGYFDKVISYPNEDASEEAVQVSLLMEELVQKEAEPSVTEPPPGIAPHVSDMVVPAVMPDVASMIVPVTMLMADPYLNQPSVSELMQTVAGSFNFLQDSELDVPCVEPPAATIPTQTFTNQNYTPSLAPVVPPSQTPSQVSFGGVQVGEIAATIPGFATPNPPPPIPMPPSHRSSPYTAPATTDVWPSANEAENTTNEWQPNQPCATDWNADTTGEWLPGDDGSGFITQISARQCSNAARNNRSGRQGSTNSGSGAALSNYHDGGPSRNNSGYQRTNETNSSMNNYQQGQQNGYQHYNSGGGSGSNSGGMGGQYRPRSNQRGSGNRNGPPSRGGSGGSNDHNTGHGRGGRSGPGSYGGRSQNIR